MKIVRRCQNYNLGKILISSILTCTRTFRNIAKIDEGIKNICISNNFEFTEHNEITAKDLWKDEIHLTESVKMFLV